MSRIMSKEEIEAAWAKKGSAPTEETDTKKKVKERREKRVSLYATIAAGFAVEGLVCFLLWQNDASWAMFLLASIVGLTMTWFALPEGVPLIEKGTSAEKVVGTTCQYVSYVLTAVLAVIIGYFIWELFQYPVENEPTMVRWAIDGTKGLLVLVAAGFIPFVIYCVLGGIYDVQKKQGEGAFTAFIDVYAWPVWKFSTSAAGMLAILAVLALAFMLVHYFVGFSWFVITTV